MYYIWESKMQPGDVTEQLRCLRLADPERWALIIPAVYDELRRLAHAKLRHESGPRTFQPTELVHEAYLRLIRQERQDWHSRSHFYGVAAHLMRLILLDCARSGKCAKRGGPSACRVELTRIEAPARTFELDELSQALDRLAQLDPRQCRIVEMRFFGGMTEEETAEALGISPKTVQREWKVARAWLHRELRKEAREP